MRTAAIVVSVAGVCLCAPVRQGNTFPLKPGQGSAEIEWASASTFRFSRNWDAPAAGRAPLVNAEVDVTASETGTRLRFATRYLTVEVEKDGSRLDVRTSSGPVTSTSIQRDGSGVVLESSAAAGERFYGLGSRRTPKLDLRGQTVRTTRPFVISSAGFGGYYPGCLACVFDLAASKPDRWRVTAPGNRIDYLFYYGPNPKEILEEHLGAIREADSFDSTDLPVRKPLAKASAAASWEDLRGAIYALQHESMSAMLTPAFDLSAYQAAGGELMMRATQLAAYIPKLYAAGSAERPFQKMLNWRARLTPYFVAYGYETRSRGTPLIHPLALQFPKDPETARRMDAFMVGDELLIAPALGPAESVRIYLPQGMWTELRTDEIYKGRQEVSVRVTPDDIPVFAKNGSIVPLAPDAAGGPTELHYFPKLGGEFFLYEEDIEEFSQVHAAPADEFMRLEIESQKERTYEWVVHHTPVCRKVTLGDQDLLREEQAERMRPGTWRYDAARRRLHVRVRAAAHGDETINIAF